MGRAFEVRKASMAKTAAAKTKIYSRFGKEIYMAAKAGIPDPEMNAGLRRIVEQARNKQVPADIIARAIEKAKGGSEDNYHGVRYEGFGPGASTFIVECLTDNDNRTVSEVRNAFTKSKSKMGVGGSVSHSYDHVAIISFMYDDEEKVIEALLDNGVDLIDIESEEGAISVTLGTTELHNAKDAIDKELGEQTYDVFDITYLPHEYVTIDEADMPMFERLITMLEECEDVQEVFHNVQL